MENQNNNGKKFDPFFNKSTCNIAHGKLLHQIFLEVSEGYFETAKSGTWNENENNDLSAWKLSIFEDTQSDEHNSPSQLKDLTEKSHIDCLNRYDQLPRK